MDLPESRELRVDEIKPYFRNPRRISEDAIDAVEESMTKYGYVQPIVVDQDNVIVVGHTRHIALQRMGVEKVQVYVTTLDEAKTREYRLADNKTGEMTSWDHETLVLELREMETGLAGKYFPDISLEIEKIQGGLDVTSGDVEKATKKVLEVNEPPPLATVTVVCPACFHNFRVRADSMPNLSKSDVVRLKADGSTE